MKCPECHTETRVLEVRYRDKSTEKRRRHQCLNPKCSFRFTTIQHIVRDPPALKNSEPPASALSPKIFIGGLFPDEPARLATYVLKEH
jgi:transcriptional regulator NrdR family protein